MRFMANVGEKLDAHSYPATAEELIEEYGQLELELPTGSETFGEAMSHLEGETFDSPEDARLAAYSAVSADAVGRRGYSDRDGVAVGEDGPDQVSF